MSGDEDWFERALREAETGGDDGDSEEGSDGDPEASDGDPAGPASAGGTTEDTGDPFGDVFGDGSADEGVGDWDVDDAAGDWDVDDAAGDWDVDDAAGDDAPFDDGDDSPFGDDVSFDSTGSDADPFGGGGGDPFDDDFASAFGGGTDFDDEAFDSDVPRVDIGVEGLDEMILGGVPERHLIACIGGAGSGKTTFGLQFLHHGLQNGQNGVFITLEQSYEDIIDTANGRGWEFDRYEEEDTLAVVDLDPVEMANSLDNIRGELPELVMDFDADRLVLDSVSLLEMMYDDEARRRTEVFDFTRSLKQAGVTTFLTSEASEDNEYASRHGIIEYLTDAVFFLQYIRGQSQETRLAVEIQKIRNADHSRERKPYEITAEGISVYQQANIF
jgi:circadian clock protein KaiC